MGMGGNLSRRKTLLKVLDVTAAAFLLIATLSQPARGAGEWITDLDESEARIVDDYVELLLEGDAKKRLESAFSYARYFLPYVIEQIASRQLPIELAYLPIIESGYNPDAVSPSGAVGIWQFMENTMGEYGLDRSEVVDERRDFWKSTEAALVKLESDYDRFGDWNLALAAYNCGINCVRRAIERTGLHNYWELIRTEELPVGTRGYVPKLLAIVKIIERAGDLGYGDWSPHTIEWKRIRTESAVHIGLMLRLLDINDPTIRLANAGLIVMAAPEGHILTVPAEYADTITRGLRNPEVQMSDYLVHRIRQGDTLSSLAARYGVKVDSITSFNPGIKARFLQLNSSVIIPDSNAHSTTGVHVVQPGDTLWGIARTYRVSLDDLVLLNAISDPDTIHPGVSLNLPNSVMRH